MHTETADLELPAKPDNLSSLEFIRNLTTYIATRRTVGGKSVADVGCGTGHGAWLLASSGSERVAAVDIDEARTRRVSELCAGVQNLSVSVMDAQRLALEAGSFQVVTCFEVIEHVPKPDLLLAGIRRILARDGVAFLSTPNRKVRLLPLQRPWNREHLREYTVSAFQRILAKHFPSLAILGISGDTEPYGYYRKLWRQNPWRVYSEWARRPVRIFRRVLTTRLTRAQPLQNRSTKPSHSELELLNMAVPAPQPEVWPFHVGELDAHCLNFFAVCGFDDGAVQRAAHEIIGSGR